MSRPERAGAHPTAVTAARLRELRQACRETLAAWDDAECRKQHHPELSPLSWHLGHAFFVESHWLREVALERDDGLAAWHDLYFPEHSPKGERGMRLPERDELLAWTREQEAINDACWAEAVTADHTLMRDDYLRRFLIQHYGQHLETMGLICRQARLLELTASDVPQLRESEAPASDTVDVPAWKGSIGADDADAIYDNEHPAHRQRVAGFRLAARPVNNAEWLAFIEDGGYRRPELWADAGCDWLTATGTEHPEHWRPHPDGGWYSADPEDPLMPDTPVHGICAHEADAFARWAGARLPHEHEWESAARQGLLKNRGRVWEWCGNALYPYPGFRAFPYERYSTPWFDDEHRVLRGGSRLTAPELRRHSFRNFYPEGHRHILGGLRLVWEE